MCARMVEGTLLLEVSGTGETLVIGTGRTSFWEQP